MDAFAGAIGVSDSDGKSTPVYAACVAREDANPHFFCHVLRRMSRSGYIETLSKGIRERSSEFRFVEFAALEYPVPPREEQNAISAFIEGKQREMDAFIANKQRTIALLQEQKAALINRAVTRGLDPAATFKPSGNEWLPEIPSAWSSWQIGHFARVGNGSTPNRSETRYWQSGAYPWLNSSVVNQGRIESADQFVTKTALAECHLPIVPPDSVLVAITGQGKTRGTAGLLTFEATINQHLAYIVPFRPIVTSHYLCTALAGLYWALRAISDGGGGTKGALTCSDVKRFQIPTPPLGEQKDILDFITSEHRRADEVIIQARREIALMQEYRAALIAEAVTGRIDVRSGSEASLLAFGV